MLNVLVIQVALSIALDTVNSEFERSRLETAGFGIRQVEANEPAAEHGRVLIQVLNRQRGRQLLTGPTVHSTGQCRRVERR